jgi:hypothetical protein
MAWKRPKKIGKWDPASAISAHPVAMERSISAEQRDSGKEFFHYMPLVLLILQRALQSVNPGSPGALSFALITRHSNLRPPAIKPGFVNAVAGAIEIGGNPDRPCIPGTVDTSD